MKFVWQEDKNKLLKQEWNISFEQVVDVMEHPNQEKYKGQKFILVEINGYVYIVPVRILDSGEECSLITVYPSRKYTNKYLGACRT